MSNWLHELSTYCGYGPRPRSVASRFWQYVDKKSETDCWNWKGAKSELGYGRLNVNRSPLYAHRLSWELHKGELAATAYVLHCCDNPSCVNPAHLRLGTQVDNMQDCKVKERNAFVITLADADLLRQTYIAQSSAGSKMELQAALAARYGVSTRTVRYIVAGERR